MSLKNTDKPFYSIATLMSGSVLGQLIALAVYPIVTRLFTPSDFGLFNVFYSYVEVFIILATGKYELAFPLTATDAEARALLHYTHRRTAVVSLLLLAVVALLLLFDALPGKSNALGIIALLIPAVVFFGGNVRLHSFLFNRYQRYYPIAESAVVLGAATSLLKVGFGLLSPLLQTFSKLGLPIATVLGQAVADLSYRLRLSSLPFFGLRSKVKGQQTFDFRLSTFDLRPLTARQVAKKYRNFPLYVLPKDLISSFSYNLPLIWLALYFDSAAIGLFSLALTFTFRPITIVNADIERVLYVRANNRVVAHEPMGRVLRHFLLQVNLVALPVCILLFFVADNLFVWLFGSQWAGCGFYVRCLLPWCYLSFNSLMLSFVPNIFSTQRTEFFFYIAMFVLRVAAMVIGIINCNFQLAILLYALVGAVISAALLSWYLMQIHRYDSRTEV